MRRGCELFVQCIDPAVPVTVWVHGWGERPHNRADHESRRQTRCRRGSRDRLTSRPVKATACLSRGALQLFPPVSGFLRGINRGLAIKIDYVDADAGSQADVGCRGCGPLRSDDQVIRRCIVEPVAAVASRDQRHLRARRQWEDMDARRRVGESGGQVSHGPQSVLR